MTCDRARALVLQPLANAEDVVAARIHLLECPLCASETADDMVDHVSTRLDILREPGGLLQLTLLVIGGLQVFLDLPDPQDLLDPQDHPADPDPLDPLDHPAHRHP
jgi:hypothetical protein